MVLQGWHDVEEAEMIGVVEGMGRQLESGCGKHSVECVMLAR